MKFYVDVVGDEDDNQQNVLRAYVQFRGEGEVYRLEEHPDPIHQISSMDLLEFIEKWKRISEQEGAEFDSGDAPSYADEIDWESR